MEKFQDPGPRALEFDACDLDKHCANPTSLTAAPAYMLDVLCDTRWSKATHIDGKCEVGLIVKDFEVTDWRDYQ